MYEWGTNANTWDGAQAETYGIFKPARSIYGAAGGRNSGTLSDKQWLPFHGTGVDVFDVSEDGAVGAALTKTVRALGGYSTVLSATNNGTGKWRYVIQSTAHLRVGDRVWINCDPSSVNRA